MRLFIMYLSFSLKLLEKALRRQCKAFTIIYEQHILNINYGTYYNIKRNATFEKKIHFRFTFYNLSMDSFLATSLMNKSLLNLFHSLQTGSSTSSFHLGFHRWA